jgi:3-oxoacyl-[acyl-carrier protein] reductase
MRLEQLKVIVTGGAQGMGRHFSMCLAQAGATVVAADIDEEGLSVLRDEGIAFGGRLMTRRLDVSDEQQCMESVAWACEQMGGLNALVNNAGIARDGFWGNYDPETDGIKKLTREQWDEVLALNLTGVALMVREVVAKMLEKKQRPGVIVNISPIARHGNRGQSNYVSAKAAIVQSTRTWSLEFAPFGIRVGAVAPGMIETPMTESMAPKVREALVGAIPVGRIGKPEDIWRAVRFIVECEYFDGRCIDVDGGLSI